MLELWEPPPVGLPESRTWSKELSLYQGVDYLGHLLNHNRDELVNYLVGRLALKEAAPIKQIDWDSASETERAKYIKAYWRKLSNRHGALKGLAMELLSASIVRHWDRPSGVIANTKLKDDEPSIAAEGGFADVVAHYPSTPATPGLPEVPEFRIHAEVSAQREMDLDAFNRQLNSAFDHAEEAIKASEELRIYCLLVNGVDINVDHTARNAYRKFLLDNGLGEESSIRIVPMFSGNFAVISRRLEIELPEDQLYFEADILAAALDEVYYQVIQAELPEEPKWMIGLFINTVREHLGLGTVDPPPVPG